VTKPRIAFAGTPQFAVPTLEALLTFGAEIPVVMTQPDRPAGRGRRLAPSPVKQAALAAGLRVAEPIRLNDRGLLAAFGPSPDLLVVVAYGLILPEWILAWPRCGAINVHASLLPRWRGAAPIQRAIMAGDKETGVSIMQMEPGLDTGPVYATETVAIGPQTSAASLHEELAQRGAQALLGVLPGVLSGSLRALAQDEAQATYARKLSKDEARLDWREPAVVLERKIRAFNPWPVAETLVSDGRRIRIWAAELTAMKTGAAPGTIVAADAAGIAVATGDGVLRLTRVQAPSAKVISAAAYLAAQPLAGASLVSPSELG
jgi:methionyl-tRNA formyltransferase